MVKKSILKQGFIGHPDSASSGQRLNRQQRRVKKRNFLQEINRVNKGEKSGQR